MNSISTIDSSKKLKKFLASNHRNEISQVLFDHRQKMIELPTELIRRIDNVLKTNSSILRMTGFDQGLTHGMVVSGGIIAGIIGACADPENPWGLSLTAIAGSLPFLESHGYISKQIKDPSIAALVFLAYQRDSATIMELKDIANTLAKF